MPISTVRCFQIRFAGQQLLEVVDELRKRQRPFGDPFLEPGGQVAVHAAVAEIVRVQPRAGRGLVELHQLLALLEAPKARRDRADVERVSRDVQQVVQDARDLGEQRADPLRALRHLDAEQLLGRQRERVLLRHRAHVVEPVEIRHRLHVGLVLDQLLGAAMQQADMRIGALDDLAVHLEDQPQHAVRGRVLRAEIHARGCRSRPVLPVPARDERRSAMTSVMDCPPLRGPSCAFSSPGSDVIASHGDRKSNWRKSCVSFTGS